MCDGGFRNQGRGRSFPASATGDPFTLKSRCKARTAGAGSPGPGKHAGVDAADPHRELAGEAGRSGGGLVQDIEIVEAGDLGVELRAGERGGEELPALVAQ